MADTPEGLGELAERTASGLSPEQRAIITAASRGNDYRQAWFLWRRAGLPGFANGNEVVRLIKPTGLFESRMGGAQCLVWKLNERGMAVAAALRARIAQGGDNE